jgi:hypothetical protein
VRVDVVFYRLVIAWGFGQRGEFGLSHGLGFQCLALSDCSQAGIGTALYRAGFILPATVSLNVSNIGEPLDKSTMTQLAVLLSDCVNVVLFGEGMV